MLLIGQPKAGSSSLVASLAEIMNVTPHNSVARGDEYKPSEGFEAIQRWHTTMVERSEETLRYWIEDTGSIIKEHVLPTAHHLEILEKIKTPIIVLLRAPSESTDCYRRFGEKHNKPVDLAGIHYDLTMFVEKYREVCEKKDNFLLVYYRDIVLNFSKTVRKILRHLNKPVPADLDRFKLAKVMFTGVGLERLNGIKK